MADLPVIRPYIAGQQAEARSGQAIDDLDPATGRAIAMVQLGGAGDVDRAVDAAQEAFPDWSALSGAERGRILTRAAHLLRDRKLELARLEVQDTGKPIAEAPEADIGSAADCLEYFGGLAAGIKGDHYDLGGNFAYTRREPLGIVGGIGAWNYPIQIAAWKAAPALACGNTMVFKPSEMTPMTAVKLAEILTEAGLPPGVFNVVPGAGEAGHAIATHPGIAKVSLTGSVPTGRKVMAAAAETLKHVTMELGGKSPLIVFDDADVDAAIAGAMLGNFYTQGEICSNGTRVFVQRPILDRFIDRLVAITERLVIGDPMDPDTQIGAMISDAHMAKVLGAIASGKAEGASVLVGGGRRTVPGRCENGWFVEPTVFADCRDDMEIVREEIFGPVMSVLTFDDEEEVVARANDTPYGLAAGVFTRDLSRGHRVVARLQAGTCWINTYNVTPIEMPFGAVKQSGFGRENGPAAIEHYSQVKSVYVELGTLENPY